MEYALLRSLRALGPGLIIAGFCDLFLQLVLEDEAVFWPLDTARLLIVGYVLGGVYGAFASKFRRNHFAFEGVDTALHASLASLCPAAKDKSWHDVSPCFYTLVDNDKSLTQKSKGIYFNGFIVTTSFDAIWLALIASVVGGVAVVFFGASWAYLSLSLAILVIGYIVWRLSLSRHIRLGEEQVRVIKKRFRAEFCGCIVDRKCLGTSG